MEGIPVKTGWLQKLGDRGLRTWATRWFELDQDGITYYLDDSKKDKRGIIKFSDIATVKVSSPSVADNIFAGGYFQIETNESKSKRVYYLYAYNKEEATSWISAITTRKLSIGKCAHYKLLLITPTSS